MSSRSFLLCALISVLLAQVGLAQELWRYPQTPLDSATSDLLWKAHDHRELHQFDEALEIYLSIADQNQGKALGVDSLTQAMFVAQIRGDKVGFETLRQRLRNEYPDSFERIQAELRSVQFRVSDSQFESAYSDILERDYGAPRPDDIIAGRGQQSDAIQKVLALHPETRLGIMGTYYSICYKLINEKRWDEAVRLATFGREAFDTHPYSDARFTEAFETILSEKSGNRAVGTQLAEPKLTVLSPSPSSTVGLRPTIAFQLTSGDYTKTRIAMTSLVLKVDGVNCVLNATVNSAIDTSLRAGVDLEVLTVTYQPDLSPGSHTVEVVARGLPVPNSPPAALPSVTRTWSFTVANSPPPPPPPPTSQTLQASKDALVYEKNPHSNEGANPRLTLEKITGKASRNLLGFNLAGINAATVSKATLVLTIDPSEQATGWGNGDTVNVKPVTVAWQEGNGKSYGLPSSQQTAGSGAGTTWFSPTDDNISNNSSNSVTQWSGGATYATAGAAPPLTVQNHQTGELRFNVTADVRAGALQGWLLRKDAENKGSKVTFYSKEGAAAAGNPALAPRLILEFGGTTTRASAKSWLAIARDLMEQGYRQLQAYRTPPALSWLGRAIN